MHIQRIYDVDLLTELRLGFLSEMKPESEVRSDELIIRLKTYFSNHLKSDDFLAFGIHQDNQIVSCGFLLIEEWPPGLSFPNGLTGTIINVYTLPAYQKKGYGTAVMQTLIEEAKKRSVSTINLTATPAGKKLYEAIGFTDSPLTQMKLNLL